MTDQQIIEKILQAKKGRYIRLTKSKDLGDGVVKESNMVIRLGVNYANMEINKDREIQPLKWGHWVSGLEGLVLEHKGNHYLRITSIDPSHPESGADVVSTRYLRNGQPVTRDEVVDLVGEKNLASKASSVYNIKFENIISIG